MTCNLIRGKDPGRDLKAAKTYMHDVIHGCHIKNPEENNEVKGQGYPQPDNSCDHGFARIRCGN